jgi:TRAP-type C4-dicarboxylate transport system permease small subunit
MQDFQDFSYIKMILTLLNKLNNCLVFILRHLAIWILAAMMFLTAADVCMRYFFSSPVAGSFELVEYMMALLVPFSLVLCAKEGSHVHVDIILEHTGKRRREFIQFLGNILSLFLFALIAWQSSIYTFEEYSSKVTSSVLYIPEYPFIGALALAFIILSLVILAEIIFYLAGKKKWNR